MIYAVELYFDPRIEQHVRDLRAQLAAQGISLPAGDPAERPHISLAVLPHPDPDALLGVAREYAQECAHFDFQLSAIGAFPSAENVLFLSPVLSQQLMSVHQEFHQRLSAAGIPSHPYYLPGNWIPHCTLADGLGDDQLPQAFALCKRYFSPCAGQIRELGVVSARPIQRPGTYPLGR